MRKVGAPANSVPPVPGSRFGQLQARAVAELAAHGWVVGRNLVFDRSYTDAIAERLPALVDEVIRAKVDVIWASTTSVAVAAVRATRKIPIVLVGASAYPIECGLIQSFARPGGNVTGIAFFQGIQVQSKLAQFVREILPGARRLAWISCPADLVTVAGSEFSPEPYYDQVARSLGFELGYYECQGAEDFDTVFPAMQRRGAQAVIVEPAGLSGSYAKRIADLAMQARLPTFFSLTLNALMGDLLSYGPDFDELYDQAVEYVDHILRGAKAADLPVEMPRKLDLIVNRKTVNALGLTIPQSLLLRAERLLD